MDFHSFPADGQTPVPRARAIYYAYLDVNTMYYAIVAYDMINLQWLGPFNVHYEGYLDTHYANMPTIRSMKPATAAKKVDFNRLNMRSGG